MAGAAQKSSPSRRVLAAAIVVGIALLQIATEFLGSHDLLRLVSKTLALVFGLPVIMLAGRSFLRYTARNAIGLAMPLFISGIASGLFFALLLRGTRAVSVQFGLSAIEPPYGASDVLRVGFMMGLTYFALWATAFLLPGLVEDVRMRTLESEKLRAEAELARLRSHLEPHFLLNTLNAIAGLVTDDPKQARRLLGNLGDLLRDGIGPEGEMETVAAQLEWLRRYAQILEARHAGKLTFRWEMEDGAAQALLPRLLLQPLVENAVKHGTLARAGGGEVAVRIRREGPKLVCVVEDDGPGTVDGPAREGAFGLLSVRRRLAVLYGPAGTVRLESTGAGTRSVVELPAETRQ